MVDFPISKGIETYKKVELEDSLVKTALALGIYLGDVNWFNLLINNIFTIKGNYIKMRIAEIIGGAAGFLSAIHLIENHQKYKLQSLKN